MGGGAKLREKLASALCSLSAMGVYTIVYIGKDRRKLKEATAGCVQHLEDERVREGLVQVHVAASGAQGRY